MASKIKSTIKTQQTDSTLKYKDVHVKNLSFSPLKEGKYSQGQKLAFVRYNHPTFGADSELLMQGPWFKLDAYGIPRRGKHFETDEKRSHIRVPLNQSRSDIKEFCDKLKEFDEYMMSAKVKDELFGNKASKYTYIPLFRLAPELDESNSKDMENFKKYGPKQPYMKLKLDTSYPDVNVNTVVVKSLPNSGDYGSETGVYDTSRTRTFVENIKTIDDLSNELCFLSSFRPISHCAKVWAQPANIKDPEYGLTFKVMKVEVEPPKKTASALKQFRESVNSFVDDDDTVADVETVETKKPVVKKTMVADVESDDDEDDVVESKKTTKKQDVSDVESDEEDYKPVSKGKMIASVPSDDDDDDMPVKVTKTVTKTPVKKLESDDEEDVKPVVKKTLTKTTSARSKKASV